MVKLQWMNRPAGLLEERPNELSVAPILDRCNKIIRHGSSGTNDDGKKYDINNFIADVKEFIEFMGR